MGRSRIAVLFLCVWAPVQGVFERRKSLADDRRYGFIDVGDMPDDAYDFGELSCEGIRWAVTSDFSGLAVNHCGAVAVTNLALYFAQKGYRYLAGEGDLQGGESEGDRRKLFGAVHKIVGNGPKITIAGGAKRYFAANGYRLYSQKVKNFVALKRAVEKGHPCAVLLMADLMEWHWALAVGWREYASKGRYIRLMDGWNRDTDCFYRPGKGARWIAATEYWVG